MRTGSDSRFHFPLVAALAAAGCFSEVSKHPEGAAASAPPLSARQPQVPATMSGDELLWLRLSDESGQPERDVIIGRHLLDEAYPEGATAPKQLRRRVPERPLLAHLQRTYRSADKARAYLAARVITAPATPEQLGSSDCESVAERYFEKPNAAGWRIQRPDAFVSGPAAGLWGETMALLIQCGFEVRLTDMVPLVIIRDPSADQPG